MLIVLGLIGSTTTTAIAGEQIRLATTTSTENSGLLGNLLPAFEKQSGIAVLSIAVGTGKALKMGELGDVDVVMVHAKAAEEQFLADGFGTRREEFMYNDFIIVGPADDHAQLRGTHSIEEALEKIVEHGAKFVSRGDDSGTHKKEQSLWKDIDMEPAGKWYLEAGQGMGKVLQMAGELGAYTLTDRGTWLNLRQGLDLELVFEADPRLFNYYGVIPINPEKHPHVKSAAAESLADWLISAEGQELIRAYTINGRPAFIPTRLP